MYITISILALILFALILLLARAVIKMRKFKKTRGQHKQSLVQIMEGKGFDVTDNQGNNPLILALRYGYNELVAELAEGTIDPNHQNENGNTALHFAAISAISKGAKIALLLKVGSKINIENKQGRSPLWVAASSDNSIAIEDLVAAGAKINQADTQGHTPIMAAIASHSHKSIELLLQLGAQVNISNNNGQNALSFARKIWNEYTAIDKIDGIKKRKLSAELISIRRLHDMLD